MRVLVAGSRTFADCELVKQTLDGLLPKDADIEIVSGGAKGADSLAGRTRTILQRHHRSCWKKWLRQFRQ